MADFLNIHTAQLLIAVGAMMWIYVRYSETGDSDNDDDSSGSDSDDESVVSVAAGVVEKYKHL